MRKKEVKPNPSPSSIPMNDPRYPIWGRVFLCKVPVISHYSTQYLEAYGLHTSGNKNVDLEQVKKSSTVYTTINAMVELYHQSQMVTIIKQNDLKTIYEICQDYTFDYAAKLNRTVFHHNMPIEDLIKIDDFSEAVYQHAGHLYGKEFARSFLPEDYMKEVINLNKLFEAVDKKLADRGKVDKKNLHTHYDILSPNTRARDEVIVTNDIDREPLPERPSMRELFKTYIPGIER